MHLDLGPDSAAFRGHAATPVPSTASDSEEDAAAPPPGLDEDLDRGANIDWGDVAADRLSASEDSCSDGVCSCAPAGWAAFWGGSLKLLNIISRHKAITNEQMMTR